ncbi:MAG: enoyl-CoA hydratase/isomerase family protein [Burkholderiaceae bacterium]
MTRAPEVACERDGAVAHVRLSHPGKFNAMSRRMWRQLREVFLDLQADGSLRCVVVRGTEGHFCAGGDIAEYPDFRFDEAALRSFHEDDVWGGLSAMLACDLPVVACIEGNCMGAGMEIASCCDIRLAGSRARFGAPIARLGFPMAPREARLVARAAGDLTAREMLLSAAVLDAAEMKMRGFINRVAPEEQLEAATQELLAGMAALAPRAARLNKQALRVLSGVDSELPPALRDGVYSYADSAEHREGIDAFLSKRRPRFSDL